MSTHTTNASHLPFKILSINGLREGASLPNNVTLQQHELLCTVWLVFSCKVQVRVPSPGESLTA